MTFWVEYWRGKLKVKSLNLNNAHERLKLSFSTILTMHTKWPWTGTVFEIITDMNYDSLALQNLQIVNHWQWWQLQCILRCDWSESTSIGVYRRMFVCQWFQIVGFVISTISICIHLVHTYIIHLLWDKKNSKRAIKGCGPFVLLNFN